jgi:predicted amidohydrolase YtcJ
MRAEEQLTSFLTFFFIRGYNRPCSIPARKNERSPRGGKMNRPTRPKPAYFCLFIMLTSLLSLMNCTKERLKPADLVLLNGEIFTADAGNPSAQALAITGNILSAVLSDDEGAKKYIGDKTHVIDLKGKFVTPGIIDGHVHFNGAGSLIVDANLMMVSDKAGLREEIGRVAKLLDRGEWITGGLWGAYEQWELGDIGDQASGTTEAWRPNRSMIDDLTPDNPCLLCRFDYKEWLANTAALEAAGMENEKIEGMEAGRDGKPTGIIFGSTPALKRLRQAVKKKSHKRMLDENRAALKALREAGVAEIHDIATPEQTLHRTPRKR